MLYFKKHIAFSYGKLRMKCGSDEYNRSYHKNPNDSRRKLNNIRKVVDTLSAKCYAM
jgi:hypothetical protein